MEKRYIPHLALLAALLLALLAPEVTRAQAGVCPPNAFLMGTPGDIYPDTTSACAYSLLNASIEVDDDGYYPCDQQLKMYITPTTSDVSDPIIIAPGASDYLSQLMHMRYYLFIYPGATSLIPPGKTWDQIYVTMSYFTDNGNLFGVTFRTLGSYQRISTYWVDGVGLRHHYNIYFIDDFVPTDDGSGGFVQIRINDIDDIGWPNGPASGDAWGIASWRHTDFYSNMPDMCTIPNAVAPQPTPQSTPVIPATWTPAAATPTAITTPGATSAPATPSPAWTATPFVYPTLPAESTATPWPVPQLATLTFPTIPAINTPAPVTVGISTTIQAEARATNTWAMFDTSVDIATRYATPIAWSLSGLDTTTGYTSTISGSVPISSTASSFSTALGSITYPVRFFRTVAAYMPNTWRIMAIVFGMFLVIFGNTVARLGVTIISEVINVIRRIWEAIPLN